MTGLGRQPGRRQVVECEHDLDDDIVDFRSGARFCYHAHRNGDLEHGHLHLFWHATATGQRRYQRPGRRRWVHTAPTHLFAISLDARGLPVGLFTVKRWVTGGHWFDAATTLSFVERFAPGAVQGHAHACGWLANFVRLYPPLVATLLNPREARLARRRSLEHALRDQRLELLSQQAIDWAADLDALEAEAARRGLRFRQPGRAGAGGAPA